ncbi:DNA helicase [Sphaerisporangium siamense]|uniref:DNA helicase IV n=1 Tax=Sphaerisporangium siamense TaxID=795645 RepID=A0A7W7G679_9ACTN|nr:ATP-binding domain-containing protein [Sphaerisporangium siamense]MBB4699248.1 DNA helicase IV [Sphaerisporangium siamense]GII86625.1 DNA helicase [Sphaerisporangium siamense]
MTSQDPEHGDQTAHEQAYVTRLYGRLDALRAQTRARLAEVSHDTGGTAQARTERDVAFGEHTRRLARLDAAENRLCFGRLDLGGGERRYIGRIGLWPESGDGDPLLVDWRAPAARPFYVATPAVPKDVRRRRHILTRGRRVVSVDDETLGEDGDAPAAETLAGEAALLAALNTGRTGRMPDVVATLRAEQDAVIRSDHRGVLVVQGGPGTGKTAVALHRAAYLLYDRPRLASQGVLVIGPNPTFLRYIGQVLPGLGETGVLSATVADLFPGVRADRAEPAAEVKGRAVMAEVLAAAVREYQAPPGAEVRVEFDTETLVLEPEVIARAAARARASRLPHNQARPGFVATLVGHLARRLAERTRELADRIEADVAGILAEADVDRAVRADLAALGLPEEPETPRQEIGGEDDVRDLRRALASDPAVRRALDALWPALTPRRLLEDLFSDPRRLAAVAPGLDEAERASLVRAPGGWSTADVPLLDEAAELLGVDDRAERARAARDRARRVAYAQGVLDIAAADDDGEVLTAGDLLDARRLADRHEESGDATVAERAAVDRTWTFGHVIVDEAQELSAMAWRMVMRRCPGRSMTLVGDLAQTSDAAGATSWDEVLRPYAGDRWRLARLSVNYRTPAEIMDAAAGLAADLGVEAAPPRSVRRTGVLPWRAAARDLPAVLARHAAREAAALRGGRLAVIVPDGRRDELVAAVRAAVPGAAFGADPDLTAPVVVLGVRQAKGLEFDAVLIADPAAILAASPRGRNDLYVAMTRATRRLGVLHPGPPPAEIADAVPELREAADDGPHAGGAEPRDTGQGV